MRPDPSQGLATAAIGHLAAGADCVSSGALSDFRCFGWQEAAAVPDDERVEAPSEAEARRGLGWWTFFEQDTY